MIRHETAPPAAPPAFHRVLAVWRRHQRVYFKFLLPNMLPPFLEPLMMILALGVGLSSYMGLVSGERYTSYLAPGMIAVSVMWSASFETTYETFFRMEYEKIYEAILASPVSFFEMMTGEVLWVSTKTAMFSLGVLLVVSLAGLIESWWALLVLPAGFLGGVVFALMGMLVTSKVQEINNFNFYLTGVITPMFLFSGAVFPLDGLPPLLQGFCRVLPMTHLVALMRSCCEGSFSPRVLVSLAVCLGYCVLLWPLVYTQLRKRVVV
jgi:lipooligosaccharide transport system permease protein